MMPNPDHEKNRTAWNDMARVHFDHPKYLVKEFLEGRSTLKTIEKAELGDVSCKSLLHLMCQFGLDTLSWAREGAIVTGVDISDTSIDYANELKEKAGLEAEFVRADVLELTGMINRKFDVIYQSYGTCCWISDIERWAKVVAHYLKPGGRLLLIDSHPVGLTIRYPEYGYFEKGPYRDSEATDYCDREYKINHELVEWQHTLADIVNALIGAGLTIEKLDEYNKNAYPDSADWIEDGEGYWTPPSGPTKYPLMFMVRARKG